MKEKYIAKVVKVIDRVTIVINLKGESASPNDKFIVFRDTNEEVVDPETGSSLGFLEEPIGTAIVKHIQENMTVIESDTWIEEPVPPYLKNIPESMRPPQPRMQASFNNPMVGDLVRKQ